MKASSIFKYRDYKAYLESTLRTRAAHEKGPKSRLAAAMGCNSTYVSQVLKGPSDLSLEQAERANRYLHHSQDESQYFLLLVQLARAGTAELRQHFAKQIEKMDESRKDLKQRLKFEKTFGLEEQAVYYSAWYYSAIHFLIRIPGFDRVDPIARKLGLSVERVLSVLEFLLAKGMIEQDAEGHYRVAPISIHLGADSPLISKHHANWRMRAISDLERGTVAEHLHYSSVITVSEKDSARVRAELVDAIERVRAIVGPSKDEKLFCYALDFFEI